jgi:chaperonin cofactor prefoldin
VTDDELKRLFDSLREENAAMHAETRRHFEVTLERLETRFDTLAESVQHVGEKLDRTAAVLEAKIEDTARETQAMIRFSHAELDRRMRTLETTQRTLEDTVSDLQSRVERLESSTH